MVEPNRSSLEFPRIQNDNEYIINEILEPYKGHPSVLSIKDVASTANLENVMFQKPDLSKMEQILKDTDVEKPSSIDSVAHSS